MRTKTNYEWDLETFKKYKDGEEDIIDHNFSESLSFEKGELLPDEGADEEPLGKRLVLVRDVWADDGELVSRTWAYVQGGKYLPVYFSDEIGTPLRKVPRRFHNELRDWAK